MRTVSQGRPAGAILLVITPICTWTQFQGMYCDLRDIDADLLTVSAHKIHPPILHFETNSKGHWREICDDCWAGANENQPSA
jgi:hypothetical protein